MEWRTVHCPIACTDNNVSTRTWFFHTWHEPSAGRKAHSSIKESNAAETKYGIFIWCSKHLTLGRGRQQLITFLFYFAPTSYNFVNYLLARVAREINMAILDSSVPVLTRIVRQIRVKRKMQIWLRPWWMQCIFAPSVSNARFFKMNAQHMQKRMQAWSAGLQRQLV